MNKTRSFLFDSIQQSPIDPLMVDVTEGPLTPPLETVQEVKLRFLNPQVWIDQLGSSTLCGANGVSVVANKRGGVTACRKNNEGLSIDISPNGLEIFHNRQCFKLSDDISEVALIPREVIELLSEAYETVAAWRSRVVRLSMDTDEYECSLMDDLCPPRTFLVELKNHPILVSVRIQCGVSYWQLVSGDTVTISVAQVEQAKYVAELPGIDFDHIWADLIQLRGMCLDEDRRLMNERSTHVLVSGG